MVRKVLVLLFLLFLAGCAQSKLYMESLASIRRDMTGAEIRDLTHKKPAMVFTLPDSNASRVEVYDMVTGTTVQSMPVTMAGGMTIWVPTEVDVTEKYFLAYRDDRLLYWGFLNEFSRAEDADIRAMHPLIQEAYEAEKRKIRRAQNEFSTGE